MSFNLAFYSAFFAVLGLVGIALLALGAHLYVVLGVVVPYVTVLLFFVGMIYRVVRWGRCPVPFRIPTTCGQQQSLPWIRRTLADKIESPFTTRWVIVRMALEVLCFRSLFRNLKVSLDKEGPKLSYFSNKWLWLGAIAFHYSFLIVLLRHLRFFTQPVPGFVHLLDKIDGFFEVGLPQIQVSGLVLLAAVIFLLVRRITNPQVRYISLPSDYFPLFLIIGIAFTGILMRYCYKVDVVAVKELTLSLVHLNPQVPEGIGWIFYVHLFLVCVLFAYFPFSKLVHMAGIFLSPTRNLPNNSRYVRHINPWNPVVKVHTYEEYEEEFREKMKEAGIPVEKE